jgi:15-cis-phytoene synthase
MHALPYLDPDVQLAMAYASHRRRDSCSVLFSLDDSLARAVSATREPMVGRIRLSWWRENLEAMARGGMAPPEPVFQDISSQAFSSPILALLAQLVEGWEVLLDDYPLDEDALTDFAQLRGRALFEAAAHVAGTEPRLAGALGEAWALAKLALGSGDAVTAQRAAAMAITRFDVMTPSELPSELRPFAILAYLAERDLHAEAPKRPLPGSPRRMLRAARFAFFSK